MVISTYKFVNSQILPWDQRELASFSVGLTNCYCLSPRQPMMPRQMAPQVLQKTKDNNLCFTKFHISFSVHKTVHTIFTKSKKHKRTRCQCT